MPYNKKSLNNLKSVKKGQILNPSGRPQGALSAKSVLRKWLELEGTEENPLTGQTENLCQLDVIVLQQLVKAKKGDTAAFKELLDRFEGKASQAIELGNLNDKPLDINSIDLADVSTEDLIRWMQEEEDVRQRGGGK